MEKSGLPTKGPVALLVLDYDGYALGEGFVRDAYEDYFRRLHGQIAEVLPTFVLLSAQRSAVWAEELGIEPADHVRVPCGMVDDPENAREYAYSPGLYLYRNGTLRFSYLNFPFVEVEQPAVAERVLRDAMRFKSGLDPTVVALPLLSKGRIQPPPSDLRLPSFLLPLTGMEWDAPPGEEPLKRPRVVKDEHGKILDYQEFPSGHLGARGRYLLERLIPFLKQAGVIPIGIIPPDGIVSERAVGTLGRMRKAFPGWSFIQLNDPARIIRFREAVIMPCLIREDGAVLCFSFYLNAPVAGRYQPIESFPSFLAGDR